jgi:predicted RecB family nuclease
MSNAQITFDVLDGYLRCKYLGALRLVSERGEISEYAASQDRLRNSVKGVAIQNIRLRCGAEPPLSGVVITREILRSGASVILDGRLESDSFSMHFDALRRVPGRSALGDFHYVPILFAIERHVQKVERVEIEVLGSLLGELQGVAPSFGFIYHGPEGTGTRVRFSSGLRTGKGVIQELTGLQHGEVTPPLLLNDHRRQCEFSARCHDQAVREDNLTLLRGIGQKAVSGYARKGILTLTQLAHTFRPRRKRSGQTVAKRYHALQAMALRDRRVYVLGKPEVATADVRIYLDLEGVPDEGFVYLIGMIVCDGATETKHSFWADTKEQERGIFEQFAH